MLSFLITLMAMVVFIVRIIAGMVFLWIRAFIPGSWKNLVSSGQDVAPSYHDMAYARDISQIVAANGYIVREHVVSTKDGYLLVIHKLESKEQVRKYSGPIQSNKVVYLHHGLLTNSELFVVGSDKQKNLPYLLVDLGYEVWLGNNRGNKYSRKHLKISVADNSYWDYSLDEFALYDIPDSIEYITGFYDKILLPMKQPPIKLVYIGFSQGCSQLFASLSLRPDLNDKIRLFVGLSPALIPKNLNHVILKSIVQFTANNNNFLYGIFGRRAMLPSVSFWCYLMGPHIYERVVDVSLKFLFGWGGKNISQHQKTVGYPHMFSNSSVKSIIHWFQIIYSERFQMFDETCNIGLTGLSSLSQELRITTSRVAPFPIAHHLDIPIVLAYGDSDILVDIEKTTNLIVSQNPRMSHQLIDIIKCPTYEHMDTLWADDVYEQVFLKVILHINKLFDAE